MFWRVGRRVVDVPVDSCGLQEEQLFLDFFERLFLLALRRVEAEDGRNGAGLLALITGRLGRAWGRVSWFLSLIFILSIIRYGRVILVCSGWMFERPVESERCTRAGQMRRRRHRTVAWIGW